MRFTEDVEDSKRINSIRSGAVIISASGMCDGGRIKHHLKYNISRPECAIVFVGFQAAGSLGRRIVDGAKRVNLYREPHAVRAKIFTIGGLSAHADRDALLGWLEGFRAAPRQCWVVHGEPLAAHALRDAIERRYGWRAAVPAPRQAVRALNQVLGPSSRSRPSPSRMRTCFCCTSIRPSSWNLENSRLTVSSLRPR